MGARNLLFAKPPYAVEQSLSTLGANLRTARLRRNLSLQDVAEKIGVERHAVAAAEKGKPSTGIAIYVAMLWVLGLLDQLVDVADPDHDEHGKILARSRERLHASRGVELDDDF
ncbi:MAG: helix-turn-helix domain-containing protein [Burkholderiaceae bacterium]|nr:helix-turn-helix domain-containing protein [Burkholderiaceae bacterium]